MTISKYIHIIKQSLSSQEQDYTQGSIRKAVVLLAIPMILELSLESVFAVVDMFFVSKLGYNAMATVGLTESVITLIYSVAIGLSTAATAVVARRVGEKNHSAASHAAAQVIWLGIAISAVCSILGAIFAPDVLRLMGAKEDLIVQGHGFTRIMLAGSGSVLFLFVLNGIFRGAGHAAMAMKSLWLASGINIVLCPIFIHFWGLEGAAVATVTARSIGVLYQTFHLYKGSGSLRLVKQYFTLDKTIILNLFQISWPATLQFIIASGSWIVLARLVAEIGGPQASAGYQVAIRNVVFFILPAWGLSNAVATLVGQNLGAKQLDRAEESVQITTRYNAIFMSGVMLLFIFGAEYIIRFYTQDPDVVKYGVQALRIIGVGYVFYGISMVMTQALNGAGDTKTPTWINFFGFWCFQVPLAYFFAKGLHWGVSGVLWAIPIAETCIALVAFYFFRRGKWKKIMV